METVDALATTCPDVTTVAAASDPIDAREASDFTECYLRREGELAALQRAELVPINLDVRATVATVLGAVSKLEPYKDQIAELQFVNHAYCAGLADYAGALWHAHGRFIGTVPPAETVTPLYEEGFALRATLLADLTAITRRGLVNPHVLDRFKNLAGYMNVAAELTGLAEALTEAWPKIEGKTLIRLDEIVRARAVGEQLVRLFAVRDKSATTEVTETRQRAFTLVVRAYEEVRRAVWFLRWYEQDADTIVPSLYAARGNRSHAKSGGEAPATTPAAHNAAPSVTQPEAPAVPGGPGGDPLTN